MKIDEIENGIVFDHIAAGKGMEVYNALRLDKLKCQVAIIQNAKSEKMGAKDIIKINELIDINLDVLCYIDKNITVNVIKNGKSVEKKTLYGAGHKYYLRFLPGFPDTLSDGLCHSLGVTTLCPEYYINLIHLFFLPFRTFPCLFLCCGTSADIYDFCHL